MVLGASELAFQEKIGWGCAVLASTLFDIVYV